MRSFFKPRRTWKRREWRKFRKLCHKCGEKPATFLTTVRRGKKGWIRLGRRSFFKSDKEHKLCGRCFRSELNSFRARRFSADLFG